jgi:tRNA (mo5U34)-methyltransferase
MAARPLQSADHVLARYGQERHIQNEGACPMATMDQEAIERRIATFPHWLHRIEVAPGVVTPGVSDSPGGLKKLDEIGLPRDCRGLRVLDIGTCDGFYAFEMERRGADVLALDHMPPTQTGFSIASELLGSKVPHVVANVYDLSPERFGKFDIVLFLGVIYHLRNPLLALDKIHDVCRKRVWVETHCIDNLFLTTAGFQPLATVAPNLVNAPIMQFYPRGSLYDGYCNYWAPNVACLRAMIEEANFAVEATLLNGGRALARCHVNNDEWLSYHRAIEQSTVPPPNVP